MSPPPLYTNTIIIRLHHKQATVPDMTELSHISRYRRINGLVVRVRTRYTNISAPSISEDLGHASTAAPTSLGVATLTVPTGPLDIDPVGVSASSSSSSSSYPPQDRKKVVLAVEDVSKKRGHARRSMLLFLYDAWAEKCHFIEVGDIIGLWAPREVVYAVDASSDTAAAARAAHVSIVDECMCIANQYKQQRQEEVQMEVSHLEGEPGAINVSLSDASLATTEVPTAKFIHYKPAMKRPRETRDTSYEYTPLAELASKPDDSKVHVYGIVVGFQQPKPSTGSHRLVCTYSLIDSTLKFHTSPLIVNMFGNRPETFPQIFRLGDIIRLHRAKKETRNGKPTLTCWADSLGSSYILFRRKVDSISGFPTLASLSSPDMMQRSLAAAASLSEGSTSEVPPGPARAVPSRDHEGRLSVGAAPPDVTEGSAPLTVELPYLSSLEWDFQTNTQHVTFHESDADIINLLYAWGMNSLHNYSLHDSSIPLTSFSSTLTRFAESYNSGSFAANPNAVYNSVRFDAVCMVLTPIVKNGDASSHVVVWDGSLSQAQRIKAVLSRFQSLVLQKRVFGCALSHSLGWPVDFMTRLAEGRISYGQLNLLNASASSGNAGLGELELWLPVWFKMYYRSILEDTAMADAFVESLREHSVSMLIDEATAERQAEFLRTCVPLGSWVRLRNVELAVKTSSIPRKPIDPNALKFGEPNVVLRADTMTHINILSPYYRDVMNTTDSFVRSCSAAVASSASAASASSAGDPRAATSVSGMPLSNLVICLTAPAPRIFCCLARIASWYPSDVKEFVSADPAVSTSSTDSHAAAADAAARRRRGAPESSHVSSSSNGAAVSKSFMFSLRIADDSAELDAIIHGQEAVTFLGLSAAEFQTPRASRRIEAALRRAVQERTTIEFCLFTYTTQEGKNPAVKRVGVFNTSFFSQNK